MEEIGHLGVKKREGTLVRYEELKDGQTGIEVTRACLINDPNVTSFELGENLFEGIIVWLGQGNGQQGFPIGKGRDVPGTPMHVYTD
jgi:hypothetical protein